MATGMKMDDGQRARLFEQIVSEANAICSSHITLMERFCESPIEVALGASLLSYSTIMGVPLGWRVAQPYELPELISPQPAGIFWPQANLGAHRVDFFIRSYINKAQPSAIVECDGHDFHERTKEQAEKDRSKDRVWQAAGHRIFRFTGREIHRNPVKCAWEVLEWAITRDRISENRRAELRAHGLKGKPPASATKRQ